MSGFYSNEVDDYFSDIESEIGRVRGKSYNANPVDFRLMELWKKQQIPIHVIIKAIDRPINSLSFVKESVEKGFAEHLKNRVGASTVEPEVWGDPECVFCGKLYCLALHKSEVFDET